MNRQLPHRLLAGRVRLHDVGEAAGEVLDALGVALDSEHLDPVPLELEGQRLAEAAEAEHDHAAGVGDVLSQ